MNNLEVYKNCFKNSLSIADDGLESLEYNSIQSGFYWSYDIDIRIRGKF